MKPSDKSNRETTITKLMKPKPFLPEWAVAPGEILQEELDARAMTQADLAARTGISTKHLNQVIKGSAPLSGEMAIKLERALGISSQVWTSMEAAYRDRKLKDESRKSLENYSAWFQNFCLADLLKRDIVHKEDDQVTRIDRTLQFFGVADPDAFDTVWRQKVELRFRRAQKFEVNAFDTAVWLRLGEIEAEHLETHSFDASAVRKILPKVRALTKLSSAEALPKLQSLCASVGIAVAFVKVIGSSRVHGSTRWVGHDRALVTLSPRFKFADIFWFTFFHEIAHALLHPHKVTYIDLLEDDDEDGIETEANQFASRHIMPGVPESAVRELATFDDVRELANTCGVDEGIVAGAYGHVTDDWKKFARLRKRLDEDLFA